MIGRGEGGIFRANRIDRIRFAPNFKWLVVGPGTRQVVNESQEGQGAGQTLGG